MSMLVTGPLAKKLANKELTISEVKLGGAT